MTYNENQRKRFEDRRSAVAAVPMRLGRELNEEKLFIKFFGVSTDSESQVILRSAFWCSIEDNEISSDHWSRYAKIRNVRNLIKAGHDLTHALSVQVDPEEDLDADALLLVEVA